MRILIADDDKDEREILAKLLSMYGHVVIACRDGGEAAKIYAQEEFDYVVTDYQMPRKNGVVLIMEIRAFNPEQKCILVSGDPPQLDAVTKKLTGEFPILQKPYRVKELLDLLK